MLEYFTHKTTKKQSVEEREPSKSPVLSPKDEQFLQQIVAEEGLSTAMADGPPLGEASRSLETQNPVANQGQQESSGTGEKSLEGEDAKKTVKKDEKDSQKATNRWSFLQKITPKRVYSLPTSPSCLRLLTLAKVYQRQCGGGNQARRENDAQ